MRGERDAELVYLVGLDHLVYLVCETEGGTSGTGGTWGWSISFVWLAGPEIQPEEPDRSKQRGRESFLIARHDEMPALPVSRRAASSPNRLREKSFYTKNTVERLRMVLGPE